MCWTGTFVTVGRVQVPLSRRCTAILNDHITSGDHQFLIYREQFAFIERWQHHCKHHLGKAWETTEMQHRLEVYREFVGIGQSPEQGQGVEWPGLMSTAGLEDRPKG